MKFAYIILAHKLPEQLHRLVSRLDDGSVFVIHVCRNTKKEDTKKIRKLFRGQPNIFFCMREDGSWGEFGIVQAVLNGMELLLKNKAEFDYLHVLSGNDYPIKSNDFLKRFFTENYGRQFLWYLPVYNYEPHGVPEGTIYGEGWKGYVHPWGAEHRFLRFEKYWYSMLGERLMIIPEERFINKPLWNVLKIFLYNAPDYVRAGKFKRELLLMLLSITHKEKRKMPQGFLPYAGSQWFSITKDCVEYVLKVHHENPRLKKFFSHTLLSDESFFTTILVHSPYKDRIAQNNFRYIRWTTEGARTHPVVLKKEDLPVLKSSGKLFARKFDMYQDAEILDLIDKEILHKT
ncbi:MAG TPA: beta-1,6-N-acetylglucosaminyltransferase [Chitinophagales bacterium]|nr:beta-1,6-N-acetylglucosaminyltransferase [Chitinophagales bacterium]